MSARNLFFICLANVSLMGWTADAQSEARIKVVQPGIHRLSEDLKFLVENSPVPNLKKQWDKTVKGLLDSFDDGFDPMKPIRVDLIFGEQSIGCEMYFPIATLTGANSFFENMKSLGYDTKSLTPDLFSITEGKGSKAKERGFLRYSNDYASIAPLKDAIPANTPHPIGEELNAFLTKGNDLTAEMKNDPTDKIGMAARLANFKELRKQLEAGIKFNRKEDKLDFEMRKLALIQNLNEAERFLVETELLTVSWITDIVNARGLAEFAFTAIPDTTLEASANLLAVKPSYFANINSPQSSAATARFNLALDSMRTTHLHEFIEVFRPVLAKRIENHETLKEPAQNAAAKKAGDSLIDILNAGITLGAVDGFADLSSVGESHTLVCGLRVADGKMFDQILNLLPQIRPEFEIKPLGQVGATDLFSIGLPPDRIPQFQRFFPGETMLYVATSKEAVWIAMGVNAQADLTAAMTLVDEPPPATPGSVIALISANVSSLVGLLDALQPKTIESKGPTTPKQKERDKIRDLATLATAGCEPRIVFEVVRNGRIIEGKLDVSECALRFVWTVIGDKAKSFDE